MIEKNIDMTMSEAVGKVRLHSYLANVAGVITMLLIVLHLVIVSRRGATMGEILGGMGTIVMVSLLWIAHIRFSRSLIESTSDPVALVRLSWYESNVALAGFFTLFIILQFPF